MCSENLEVKPDRDQRENDQEVEVATRRILNYAGAILVSFLVWGCGVDQEELTQSKREATDTLFDLLEDKQVEGVLAANAIDLLQETDDPRLTRVLVQALSKKSGVIVFRAIRALGQSGDQRAKAPLKALLDDERWDLFFRMEAATALERLGNLGTAGMLRDVLRNAEEGHLRSSAVGGLGRLGRPEGIADIRTAFREDPDPLVQGAAAVALARLGDRESLPAIGERLLSQDSRMLDIVLIEALEIFGDSTAAAYLGEAFKQIRYYDVRQRCLEALGTTGSKTIGPYLQEMLSTAGNASDRSLAAQGLAHIRDSSAVPLLMAAFRTDPINPIKLASARTLAILGFGSGISSELGDIQYRNDVEKARSLEVLGAIGDVRRVVSLREALIWSRSEPIEFAAVKALGGMESGEAVAALSDAFSRDNRLPLRRAIVEALRGISLPAAQKALKDVLEKTEYTDLRTLALEGLGESGNLEHLRTLRKYLNEQSPEVRLEAARGVLKLASHGS